MLSLLLGDGNHTSSELLTPTDRVKPVWEGYFRKEENALRSQWPPEIDMIPRIAAWEGTLILTALFSLTR